MERVHDTPGGERERETATEEEMGGRETEKRWKWKRGAGRAKTISQAL